VSVLPHGDPLISLSAVGAVLNFDNERLGETKSMLQGMGHFQWKRLIQTKHSVTVDRQGTGDADSKTESPDLMGYGVALFFAPSQTLMH